MAYDPSNYINGVDQRTVAQQRKDEREQAAKRAAKLKEGMRKRILNVKTKSPSATDVQSGKVSGAVKSNKSKTTAKETAMKKSKSMDKMPARKMPKGFEFPKNKKAVPNPPGVQRTPASGTKKTMEKVQGAKPSVKKPMPKTTTKAPAKTKMTPQDAAMKKILEKKYGKIYG